MAEPVNKYKKYEIDPEQYDPESFGRFGANMWNNANELSDEALDALGFDNDERISEENALALMATLGLPPILKPLANEAKIIKNIPKGRYAIDDMMRKLPSGQISSFHDIADIVGK